jgi:hypothetical protein
MRIRAVVIAIALLAALLIPAGASARHGGDDEVRASGTCGAGAKSEVKVKARDGARLEVEIEVEHVRDGSRWSVTLVQEGRVAWRGVVRARSGRFEVRRTLRDLAGADRVRVTARGPGGTTCRIAATLPGD